MNDARQRTARDGSGHRPDRRLFLGIWPDEPAAGRMTRLMQGLRQDGIMPGKPVDTDRLHLTLFHLGDFVDQFPPDLLPAVRAAAANTRSAPFEISFDRVGGARGPLLLRVSDDLESLVRFRTALGSALRSALVKAGLHGPGDSAFTPHVTLSYDPGNAPETRVEPVGWTVRGYNLVESQLGKHRHLKLDSWTLAP